METEEKYAVISPLAEVKKRGRKPAEDPRDSLIKSYEERLGNMENMLKALESKNSDIKMRKEEALSIGEQVYLEKISKEEKLAAKLKRDNEMVSGLFRYEELTGGTLTFIYHQNKGDGYEKVTLKDGEFVTIKRGIANQINEHVTLPIYEAVKQSDGSTKDVQVGTRQRASFTITEARTMGNLLPRTVNGEEMVFRPEWRN